MDSSTSPKSPQTPKTTGGYSFDVEAQESSDAGDGSPSVSSGAVCQRCGTARQTVVFRQITYEVRQGRRRAARWQPLLRDVSGYVAPQELTALMGPSGSGKSTLLDLLAGRKTAGRLAEGSSIRFNGRRPTSAMLRRNVGYVEQTDTLLPLLTPSEMLLYTSELKHPHTMPRKDKQQLVDALIEKLRLQDCANTTIGSSLARGISGGEAKRVSVGLTMITCPAVLLCDEPTSGLDSWNQHAVVEALRDLARGGIAVASSIHAPSPDTFALFDRVLILQRGRAVYFGETGEACSRYFAEQFPALRPMRPWEGVADYIIDVTSSKHLGERAASEFADAYAASELCRSNEAEMEALLAAAPHQDGNSHKHSRARSLLQLGGPQGTITPWWWGLWVLFRFRTVRGYSRPVWVLPRALSPLIPVFLLATVYWGLGNNIDVLHVTSIAGVLFMWTTSAAYGSMGLMPTIIEERAVFLRERADGLYTPATYLLYKLSEEFSVSLTVTVPYAIAVFYIVRLQGSLALFWLVDVVTTAVATVLALLVGALAPNQAVAGMALPMYTTSLLYFSGFLITWGNIPPYWIWYSVIAYLRYAWGALMVNQFEGDRNIPAYGGVPVLQYYDLENVNKWAWLGWEALFFAAFTAAAWAALSLVRHQRR
ncbi:P-loop containing nucleoside triphosphate hydrolase [Chlorella sorokiniana]|uniref:P-loop containing nucleoside triphosphate hydrolase n=1 Tax=Chlorella sorokiniana TaxID=3076 RepID=A0A2P6TPC9_CHLSO|nr:P-loop containing nucleoside triphosphate hydrolase [Chlorella sorokiniana]|eukprot:PRW55890.1 P-loop containing nucleoside triphosphate hydrolase [Chlorella sorokiniana]